MNIQKAISEQLSIRESQVAAVIELLGADNTIPFIARYRKEATGSLDEEQLRQISELYGRLRALDERRETVLKSIDEQGKLSPELKVQIEAAQTMTILEDLYQPYKPKRRTRAMIARERGLQPLADLILAQARPQLNLEALAQPFLNEAVPDSAAAWAGAGDIVAETISDHPQVRQATREKAMAWGLVQVARNDEVQDPKKVYELYYQFEARVDRLRPHQVLAINRGEQEKVLKVKVVVTERDWRAAVQTVFSPHPSSPLAGQMQAAIDDAAERLLLPAIERDVRRALAEKADSHAIQVFAENLRALLNQPPLAGWTVLGIDPGFRTGCKLAVVDPTGKVLLTGTIYPHEPQNRRDEALKILAGMVKKLKVNLVVIGNGTASRETESLAADLIRLTAMDGLTLHYLIANEAGASVYSASPLARSELPELDVSLRGAVSIARRIQDPLAELVKIDPKSIGVGLYQHDVDQKNLSGALSSVVESVVNRVGVDLNTASPALLTYVSGVGPKLAEQIVAHRDSHGPFQERSELYQVPKLGPKAFEQAAGFLRIHDGRNPLDASAIHPESYPVALAVLREANLAPDTPPRQRQTALEALLAQRRIEELAQELQAGVPTLADIFEQLVRPGRDPRQDLPQPVLRSDVLKMEDLSVGMRLKGTVRNVVDFGTFIDIGVKQDGLLHRSQMPRGLELKVGDVLEVEIVNIDIDRGRIGLRYG